MRPDNAVPGSPVGARRVWGGRGRGRGRLLSNR
jgi:hypothetical protein